ncbi:MAG: hypothetical protein ACRENY_02425 [Candidatus Dormibacteria bacterium]
MPPLTDLALLALLFPAAATLICSALGRPWPRRPDFWARAVLRLGLLLTLADVALLLHQLQPGGTLQLTLWSLEPDLPVTLSVGSSGLVLAVIVLVAALVVSGAAGDRRPLASAALGLAVLGAIGAAFAGDLLGIYIGLQLSSMGGIGLSYARQPRAASRRMVWAVVADQTVGLIWLGGLVELLHHTATLQLTAIPTSFVNPALVGLLLLPAVVRLAGCGLVASSALTGSPASRQRTLDVADWLAVVAVPTSLLLLIRVLGLAGGSWPQPWFGTCLDLLGLVMGGVALFELLISSAPGSGIRGLLLSLGALVVVGFGQNNSSGVVLGLGSGIALELSVAFLPRAALGSRPGWTRVGRGRGRRAAPPFGVAGAVVGTLGCALALGVSVLGLDLSLRAGLELGTAPALVYLVALAALVLAALRLRRLTSSPLTWAWSLWLPGLCLSAAAILPGWALTTAVADMVPPGTSGPVLLSVPDPLAVLAPGLLWPGGYLILLIAAVAGGSWAVRLATGSRALGVGSTRPMPLPVSPMLAGWAARLGPSQTWRSEVRGWSSILLELADREVAERPIWLWLAAAAAAGWLLAEIVKP